MDRLMMCPHCKLPVTDTREAMTYRAHEDCEALFYKRYNAPSCIPISQLLDAMQASGRKLPAVALSYDEAYGGKR